MATVQIEITSTLHDELTRIRAELDGIDRELAGLMHGREDIEASTPGTHVGTSLGSLLRRAGVLKQRQEAASAQAAVVERYVTGVYRNELHRQTSRQRQQLILRARRLFEAVSRTATTTSPYNESIDRDLLINEYKLPAEQVKALEMEARGAAIASLEPEYEGDGDDHGDE